LDIIGRFKSCGLRDYTKWGADSSQVESMIMKKHILIPREDIKRNLNIV